MSRPPPIGDPLRSESEELTDRMDFIMTAHLNVHIDAHTCEGHGLCLQLAPDVFDLTEDEIATCEEHPDDMYRPQIEAAAAACPRMAITVTDDRHTRTRRP